MKKSLVSLLSGLCLTLVSINAFAGLKLIDIGLIIFQEVEKDKDPPSKGYRAPEVSVICTIDFENHRIATSLPYEITTYELWDEYGEIPIVSYASDSDLVEYMEYTSGIFQLRLITSEQTYLGYLDL